MNVLKKIVCHLCLVVCLLFCTGTPAFSQEELVLSVSPVRFELEAASGQKRVELVELTNKGSRPVTIETSTADFTADGQEGRPRFVPAAQSPWSMSNWIETEPARFTAEPGETKEVKVTISVPEDASPGGHYAAVLFGSVPDGPGATAVVAKIGTLLLLSVPGEIVEYGTAALSVPRLLEGGPVTLSVLFTNEGNVHVKPEGAIQIRPLIGNEIAELRAGGENVLPDSSRQFAAEWEDVPTVGIFTAQGELTYGSAANQAAIPRVTFVVLPWRPVLGGLALFAAGVAFALLLQRKEAEKYKKIPHQS